MALVSTQPVTEISIRNVSWGKGGRCICTNDLTTFHLYMPNLWKSWSLHLLKPLSKPVQGLLYLYLDIIFRFFFLLNYFCVLTPSIL